MIYKKDYIFIMSEKLRKGESGGHSIVKGIVNKGVFLRMYSPRGFFYADRFASTMPTVKLLKDGDTLMSDTPMEQEGLRVPVMLAYGKVLVIGLGIGLYPTLLARRNKRVRSILIVEESKDVVKLVYPHIKSSKTDICISEGKEFLRGCVEKFDFIFIDVWAAFTTTLKQIDEWTELAKPCLVEGGMVRCWLQELYDRIKDKLPKEPIELTGLPAFYEPCLICGKTLRYDYAGLCADCADDMEVSELFVKK